MSTKSETKKVTKDTKDKKDKKDIIETEEMEAHSIWNGRLKSNNTEAKFFKEFLTDLGKRFIDEDGFTEILSCYWGDSIEELDLLIKQQNKREKKVKVKFTPEKLDKAKNAYNLYCTHFASQCKDKEVKFTLKDASESWKTISEKEKSKFIKEALKQKEEYQNQYNSLKAEAVKNGSLSADKPKGPITAFFRYLDENREIIKAKLIKSGETEKLNTKITSEAGKLWKELSAEDKEPYEKAYSEEKEKYSVLLEEWKSKETSRLKKLDGKSEDIKVEESGDSKNKNTTVNTSDGEDSDVPVEKVSKSKKTSKVEKVEKTTKAETKAEKVEKTTKAEPKAESKAKKTTTPKVSKTEKTPKVEKVSKKVNLTEDEDEEDDEE
jgi:high mobility group protein B1